MLYMYNIKGETPSKKNSRVVNTRTGRSFPNKKYTDWHKSALIQLLGQAHPVEPISSPIKLTLEFIHGDLRRRDSDNGASSILDTLKDSGIIQDDNWQIVREIVIRNTYLKNAPECNILIEV